MVQRKVETTALTVHNLLISCLFTWYRATSTCAIQTETGICYLATGLKRLYLNT